MTKLSAVHVTLFVSEAWDLDPDAITFGKAISGVAFQLSGAVMKSGRTLLSENGQTVMQSHTYAGSSTRALITATGIESASKVVPVDRFAW